MKQFVTNISGKDLKFGTRLVPNGEVIQMSTVDAFEFAQAGLVRASSGAEINAAMTGQMNAVQSGVVNAAAAAKAAPAAQPAAAKAAAAKASADDKK